VLGRGGWTVLGKTLKNHAKLEIQKRTTEIMEIKEAGYRAEKAAHRGTAPRRGFPGQGGRA